MSKRAFTVRRSLYSAVALYLTYYRIEGVLGESTSSYYVYSLDVAYYNMLAIPFTIDILFIGNVIKCASSDRTIVTTAYTLAYIRTIDTIYTTTEYYRIITN